MKNPDLRIEFQVREMRRNDFDMDVAFADGATQKTNVCSGLKSTPRLI